jgi:hypothetical protein
MTTMPGDVSRIENSINDRAAEMLLLIFKHVFWASCVQTDVRPPCTCAPTDSDSDESALPTRCVCRDGSSVQMTWNQDEDPLNPYIFPYATSFLCKHWYNLMRSGPTFWTRIVVIFDEDCTRFRKVQSHRSINRSSS